MSIFEIFEHLKTFENFGKLPKSQGKAVKSEGRVVKSEGKVNEK